MADIIQSISKFSQDVTHNAIEHAVQDKQAFTNILEAVESHLKKPPKKQKKVKMYGNKDDEIFQQKAIPQIRDKLSEYDRLEMNGKHLEWKVCFDFIQDSVDEYGSIEEILCSDSSSRAHSRPTRPSC